MLRLDGDWRGLFKRSWSMRWWYAGGAFGIAQAGLPYFLDGLAVPPIMAGMLTTGIVAGGMFSRILYQPGMGTPPKPKVQPEDEWV